MMIWWIWKGWGLLWLGIGSILGFFMFVVVILQQQCSLSLEINTFLNQRKPAGSNCSVENWSAALDAELCGSVRGDPWVWLESATPGPSCCFLRQAFKILFCFFATTVNILQKVLLHLHYIQGLVPFPLSSLWISSENLTV